jgi:prepilin-type N-terminal cleavage/methylation domain-containing protein
MLGREVPVRPVRRIRGFSLIEILIALAVLVPVVVVAAGVLPFYRASSSRAWTQVDASDIAREQMERARGVTFDDLASLENQVETRNGTVYKWSMAVTPLGSPALRKRVVVDVEWDNPKAQSLAMETTVARMIVDPSSSESSSPSSPSGNGGSGNGGSGNGGSGNGGSSNGGSSNGGSSNGAGAQSSGGASTPSASKAAPP